MRWWMPFLYVGVGGAMGSVLRYLLSLLAQRFSLSFPYGTLAANLLGCLVIGAVMTLAASSVSLTPAWRLFLATGICGGFTTMSSFVYELMRFVQDRAFFQAGGYFVLTLAGCVLMFVLGAWVTRWATQS
jgi:CrcB protein